MASGVSSCTKVWRMTTLTMSAAPATASKANEKTKCVDRPKAKVATPYSATAPKSTCPMRR